jgi:hypothetical protein
VVLAVGLFMRAHGLEHPVHAGDQVMSVVIFDLKEEGQFGAIAVLGLVMPDLRLTGARGC